MRRGATLIEVMIALVIMSLVAVGIASTMRQSWQSQETLVAQNDVQRRTWEAMDRIVDILRRGREVKAASSTNIRVMMPNVKDPDDSWDQFYRVGNNLTQIRYRSPYSSSKVIMGQVTALTFSLYKFTQSVPICDQSFSDLRSDQAIQISLTVKNGRYQATASSMVYLRNWTPLPPPT